jgi:hypothetical protein
MSLHALIADIEARRMTLTVVNAEESTVEEVRQQYADRNLEITHKRLDGDPRRFAVLSRDGEFVTALSLEEVRAPPGGPTTVLDHLDETLFTSYSIRQMFLASREIEDRAWRVEAGELHAGFQTLDVLEGQTEAYNQLGEHTDLSVHAYAVPGDGPAVPNHDHYTLHVEGAAEISETWFVVYDGGGIAEKKCALLAEERDSRSFYGFWSYDPDTVDYLLEYLRGTYGRLETDGDSENDSAAATGG